MAFTIHYYSTPVIDDDSIRDYWSGDNWAEYYLALKTAYGKDHAQWKFRKQWMQNQAPYSGSSFDDFTNFNNLMKREGMPDIQRTSIVTEGNSFFSSIGSSIPLIVGGVAGVYLLGQYLSAPKISGSPAKSTKLIVLGGLALGVTFLGATTVDLSGQGNASKSPAGVPLKNTKRIFDGATAYVESRIRPSSVTTPDQQRALLAPSAFNMLRQLINTDPATAEAVQRRVAATGLSLNDVLVEEAKAIGLYWSTPVWSATYAQLMSGQKEGFITSTTNYVASKIQQLIRFFF